MKICAAESQFYRLWTCVRWRAALLAFFACSAYT